MAAAFQYTALKKNGKEVTGVITAENQKIAKQKLRDDGLLPLEVVAIASSALKKEQGVKNIDKKISLTELSQFTRELSALLGAGLELEESISSLAKQTPNKHFKGIIGSIHARIMEGFSLARGIEDFPKAFPPVYCATIKASENAGKIAEVLAQLSDYLDRQILIRQKTMQALIYPAVLTVIGFAIVVFLLSTVVPTMLGLFADSKKELPFLTVVLMKLSAFIKHYGLFVLLALVLGGLWFKRAVKSPALKEKVDRFILKLPLIGKMIKLIQTERFLRSLGILMKSNVPILKSFDVASALVSVIPIQKSLIIAKERVREGTTLRAALNQTEFFTPSTLQLVHAGESTSNLGEMITRAADNQQRIVNIVLDTFLALFEPILILVMGGIVLFIVLAVLLPIFQLSNLIG